MTTAVQHLGGPTARGHGSSAVRGLACRECGVQQPLAAANACTECFGPLEVAYDLPAVAASLTREEIAAGPPSIWRYAALLPELPGEAPRVDLGAGFTPLVPAPRLGAALGLHDLWLKNDTLNPTGSFKDRVVSVALSAARRLGMGVAACASTGNLAQAVSAHAAASGMEAYVLIPMDLEPAKITATALYGANVVAVEGSYDQVNRLCAEAAGDLGWAFVNVNLRPYYAEGSKTLGFEIAEQLGWELPAQVVAPMASGAMLVKIDKAFAELVAVGLVEETPWRMFGAQATGCSPISAALKEDRDLRPVKAATLARSLAIGDPADGWYALDAVRRTGGFMEDVSDAELVAAIGLLARTEGILAETAGGVTVATLGKLVATGRLDPRARTVAVISGHGLKTLDAVTGGAGLDGSTPAPAPGPTWTIPPRLDALLQAIA